MKKFMNHQIKQQNDFESDDMPMRDTIGTTFLQRMESHIQRMVDGNMQRVESSENNLRSFHKRFETIDSRL